MFRNKNSQLLACIVLIGCLPIFLALWLPLEWILSLVSDDAFYYFKVAHLAGSLPSPTFDGLTITTGFHPLFAAITTALAQGTPLTGMAYVRFILVINSLLNLVAAYGIFHSVSYMGNAHTGHVATLLFVMNPFVALLPFTGMEASLNMACLASFLAVWVRLESGNPTRVLISAGMILSALTVCSRVDSWIVLMAACGALCTGPGRRLHRLKLSILIGIAATLALVSWMGLCYFWSGDWLQGSARMKSWFREIETSELSSAGHIFFGLDLAVDYLFRSLVKVPALVILGVLILRQKEIKMKSFSQLFLWVGAPLALAVAYGIKLPHVQTWYFAPVLVLWTVGAGMCYLRLAPTLQQTRFLIVFWTTLAAVGTVFFTTTLVKGRNIGQRDMWHAATQVAELTDEDARIGAWNAGIYGYFSGRQVINLDGLINNEIYEAVENGSLNWPYWEQRNITHLLDYEPWLHGHSLVYNHLRLVEVKRFPATYARNDILLMAIVPKDAP